MRSRATCDRCLHFDAQRVERGDGYCRRYPPTVHIYQWEGEHGWLHREAESLSPTVNAQQWCGEWAAPR